MTDLIIITMTKENSNLEKHNKQSKKKIGCKLEMTILLEKNLSQIIHPFIDQ